MRHRILAVAAAALLLAGCSLVGIRSGYEQPTYQVLETIDGQVEIRRYPLRLAAETPVGAQDDQPARDAAFRTLFAYISGANEAQSEIAMTAPVETGASGEEITMTVPVETTAPDGGREIMRFFLPASYTAATAPEPTDPKVRIVEIPAMTLAVLRFSGFWDEETLRARGTELLAALDGSDWRPARTPSALFYDPPWTLPFLRRNEVAVPVTPRGST